MELTSLPINVFISRNTSLGQHVVFYFAGDSTDALPILLAALPAGAEVSASAPGNSDGEVMARRAQDGFEIRRRCRGVNNTWRQSSMLEAINWLLPGIKWSEGRYKGGECTLWLPHQ